MMGRSIASIRQEVNGMAERWEHAVRLAGEGDRPHGLRLAGFAKFHASDAFYGCDDPVEAAVFSALVELLKAAGSGNGGESGGRPGTAEPGSAAGSDVDP